MFGFRRHKAPEDLEVAFRSLYDEAVAERPASLALSGDKLVIPMLVVGGGAGSFGSTLQPRLEIPDPLHGASSLTIPMGKLRAVDLEVSLTLLGPNPLEGPTGLGALAHALAFGRAVVVVQGDEGLHPGAADLVDRYALAGVYVVGSPKFIRRFPGEAERLVADEHPAREVFQRVVRDVLKAHGS